MPITGYLKIPDIDGESLIRGHENEIDVQGLDWGLARPLGPSGSRRARGRVEMRPLVALKWVDRATPYLAQAVAQGRAFDEIVLTVARETGGEPQDYLTLTMKNCILSEHGISNGGFDDAAVLVRERLAIAFESITVHYREMAGDGSAGTEHEAEIDFSRA